MQSQFQLEADKRIMRARARARRQAISAIARKEAAEALARIGLDFLHAAPGILGGYYPVRSELDSRPLLQRLVDDGWRLALPIVTGPEPLAFHGWTFGEALRAGAFGIPQPFDGPRLSPNILLVPMLAFDRRCYRLGYGSGHYDRTLAAFRQDGPVSAIGLAFAEQEVDEVPIGPHDQRLDWILTPAGPIGPEDRT
jgi:5-formyltetrahydrofolate cyclo-ligase